MKSYMIKAIQEDRKTVTRRKINPQPHEEESLETGHYTPALIDKDGVMYPADYQVFGAYTLDGEYTWKPRYHIGEVVNIKETLFRHPYLNEAGYVLDETPVFINQTIGDCLKWRWSKDILSAMFMPQEAARYFIQITDVRAERTRNITIEDCHAEGIWLPPEKVGYYGELYREAYFALYDSINGKGAHKKNWDWRYEFRRVENG